MVVSLGPTLVVALWAASYLVDCFQHLLAPGGGLVLPLQTRAGVVTLRSESYTVDPFAGALFVRGLSIDEPNGERLGDAGSLKVRFTGLGGPSQGVGPGLIQVTADSIRLKLRRDAEGRLPALDYLPETTDEESTTPFVVRLSDAVVDWVDEAGGEPWSTRIRVDEASIDGVGPRWSARGKLEWQEGGRLSASVRSSPDVGLWGEVDFEQLSVGAVVGRLQTEPSFAYRDDLAPVRARAAVATGRMALVRPRDAPIQVRAVVQAQAEVVAYGTRYVGREVRFSGFVSNDGLSGEASGTLGQAQAEFVGSVRWTSGLQAAGSIRAEADGRSALPDWLRSAVPTGFDFRRGRADGWLAYSDQSGVRFDGRFRSEAVEYAAERIEGVEARVAVSSRRFAAVVERASWLGAPLTGHVDVGLSTRTLGGSIDIPSVPVRSFLTSRDVRGVRANLAARGVLSGSLDSPAADLRVAGDAQVEIEASRWVPLSDLQVSLLLDRGIWRLQRAVANGPGDSVLAASGSFDLARNDLNVEVFASGIQIADFVDSVDGAVAAAGRIVGTLTAPVFLGHVEVYALKRDAIDIPLITAEVRVDRESVSLADVKATRGPGRIYAGLTYSIADQTLDGRFRADGVELSDWFDGNVAGAVSLVDGTVGGTLTAPVVSARLETEDLIVRGVDLGRATAEAGFESGRLTVGDAIVRGANGRLSAGGYVDVGTLTGEWAVQADSLVLGRLLADLPDRTKVGGSASGTAWLSIYEGRLARAVGSGTVQDLTFNPTYLGNGLWNFEADGTVWSGNVLVGQPGRYIQAEDIVVDTAFRLASGAVVAYDVPVRDLWFAARPYLVQAVSLEQPGRIALPTALVDQLDRLDGKVDADIKWSGQMDDPSIVAPSLAVRDLELGGQPNGTLQVSADRRAGTWSVREARWRGGPGNIRISGRLVEGGDVDFEGTVSNFDPNWLSQLVPGWPNVAGRASLDFVAAGPVASPVVQATLTASLFDPPPPASPEVPGAVVQVGPSPLNIQLSDILIQDGEIRADGLLNYRGFSGRLEGTVPFRYPFQFPDDAPISFRAELPRTELRRLAEFVPSMDTSATEGAASIRLIVGGTVGSPQVSVEADLEASRFALVGTSTRAENLRASVRTTDGRVVAAASLDSSRGGRAEAEASFLVQDLLDRLSSGAQSMLETAVAGKAAIRNLAATEAFGKDGKVDAVVDGDIVLSGTLGRAVLSSPGRILVRRLELVVPSELPTATQTGPISHMPILDLGFSFGTRSSPIEVRVANAAFELVGAGTLKGPVLAPNAVADLEVVEGAIRLPNARIALDEGGTVRFSYDPGDPLNTTRLDVAVTGRTSLAASRFPGLVERFDIRLDVRGDMLRPDTQSIVANSDPPGLSQERILALLGQSQVFEGLSLDRDGGLEQRLGQAAAGFAIPVLLDPITAELARGFGLDYLNFEYNAFEGPSVAAAKTLSRMWAIQARRQLVEQPGLPVRYDLRLTYTPFRRNRFARNIVFSFGQDQDRPWNIAIEFTERF